MDAIAHLQAVERADEVGVLAQGFFETLLLLRAERRQGVGEKEPGVGVVRIAARDCPKVVGRLPLAVLMLQNDAEAKVRVQVAGILFQNLLEYLHRAGDLARVAGIEQGDAEVDMAGQPAWRLAVHAEERVNRFVVLESFHVPHAATIELQDLHIRRRVAQARLAVALRRRFADPPDAHSQER